MSYYLTEDYYNGFLEQEKEGYITIRPHKEDSNLVILNYTDKCVHERAWNEFTMKSRGFILDISKLESNKAVRVVANPFEKFFNYGENELYEENIDFNKEPEVYEKLDGSLGITYYIGNDLRVATRGSFHSEQAIVATNMLNEKYKNIRYNMGRLFPDNSITLLFEIIYPENKIVVDYKGESKLVLLGMRRLDGTDYSYSNMKSLSEVLDIPISEKYSFTLDNMMEMREYVDRNTEGWILRYDDYRIKVKCEDYLKVHRAKFGMSDKQRVRYWSEFKENDILEDTEEEFKPQLESMYDFLNVWESFIKGRAEIKSEKYIAKTAKELSQLIEDESPFMKALLFEKFRKGKTDNKTIRRHIYRNYRDYLKKYNNGDGM